MFRQEVCEEIQVSGWMGAHARTHAKMQHSWEFQKCEEKENQAENGTQKDWTEQWVSERASKENIKKIIVDSHNLV